MDVAVSTAHPLHARRQGSGRLELGAACAGIAGLTAIAAALGASAPTAHPVTQALLRGSMVAAPLAVALYASRMPQQARFARLLATAGAVSFVTTLAESSNPSLYSAGRIAGWSLEVVLAVVLLAFPDARLKTRVDRRIAGAMTAVYAAFYLPTLLVAGHFRVPSPYTSCTRDCPHNAFSVVGDDLSALSHAMIVAGSVLVFAVMLAVLLRLQHRIADAGPLERQLLVPVLAVGMVRVALVGAAIVGRDLGGARNLSEGTALLIAWMTPCIALAFLVGVVRSRLFAERALRRLALCVRTGPDAPSLERAFAEALDDRSVRIVFPRDRAGVGWMDAHGDPVELPADAGSVHLVRGRDGGVVAALLSDPALSRRHELLGAATDLAAVAFDNLRLTTEARAAAREVRASRARIVAAADRERRRIERDLHDGAQQRLVALRIELGLVEDLALRDPERCAARIRELEAEVDEALEELRSLAHGVCPPLLADRGLAEALRAAATRSAVPVALELDHVDRYSPEVESTVYFCTLEALQNVAKHATGARRAVVRLDGDAGRELRFSVRDDGPGAPGGVLSAGAGVTNMRDRVAALGGELRIASRPGVGTEVCGRVPIARHAQRRERTAVHAG